MFCYFFMLFSFLLEGGFLILLLYFFSINIFVCDFLSKKMLMRRSCGQNLGTSRGCGVIFGALVGISMWLDFLEKGERTQESLLQ